MKPHNSQRISAPKHECEIILGDGMERVEIMFDEHGGFHPFGRVLTAEGEVDLIAADLEPVRHRVE